MSEELKCWSCKVGYSEDDRLDCDGCCWKCGVEIDYVAPPHPDHSAEMLTSQISVDEFFSKPDHSAQPVAWIKAEVLATLRGDECCYAFGEQNKKGSLVPLYRAQPLDTVQGGTQPLPERMTYAKAEELSDHPMTYMNAYDAGLEAGLLAKGLVTQGDAQYKLADKVREALDRQACPNGWMVIAYEAVVANYTHADAGEAEHLKAENAALTEENWQMNPCKQGHRDVGACQGMAFCYTCDETLKADTTQEAFEQWNATHPDTPQ
jgi:hypothetical protein